MQMFMLRKQTAVPAPRAVLLLSWMLVTLVSALAAAGCASTPELTSSWNDHQVVIDGQATEWTTNVNYLNDAHVSLGVRNDGEYLYMVLMSSEQQFRRQMLGLGLTVWFERDDGGKIGIHYPVGMTAQRRGEMPQGEEDNPESRDEGRPQFGEGLEKLEILGSDDKDRRVFSTVDPTGIAVKIGDAMGSTVYELRIPLRTSSDRPFAVGVDPGGVVKLGLETGKFEGRRSDGGGIRMGGRRGGGRRGYGGGEEREGSEENRGEAPKPLDFWAKIHLSASTSGGTN